MQNEFKKVFSSDNLIKLGGLILLIIIIVYGYFSLLVRHNQITKMVKINLIKITTDYTAKATNLVLQANPNISEQEKMDKAQKIMQIVGSSIEGLLDDYAKANHTIIIQAQTIANDAGNPLIDITEQIESQIDGRLNKENIQSVAK